MNQFRQALTRMREAKISRNATCKALRDRRRAAHECTECGDPLDPQTCADCRLNDKLCKAGVKELA